MKVHHLNCGTMRPWGAPDGLVCHVLLIETPTGLALVDSGFGLQDAAAPGPRFGPSRFLVRPAFDVQESAVRQVAALGYDPGDVRDIVLTHFDADHTGGLADFPNARVHLTGAENRASLTPRTLMEKSRYLPAQRNHGPRIVEHDPERGEAWRGFAAAVELSDITPDLVLISLPGHTRGHAAVAVNADTHWVLHVGDAFYHRAQVDTQAPNRAPRALVAMESLIAVDRARVRANHSQLSELWAHDDPDLVVVNAHDPGLLDLARARQS